MKDIAEGRFGLYISVINRAAQSFFYHRLKGLGIGPGQQAYLLSLMPGETIVQEELAKRLRVDRGNVTRAVQALESAGFISRSRSHTDRRAWNITLTEQGIRTRGVVETIARQWIEKLRNPLSDQEWNTLEQTLQTIAESLDGTQEEYHD
ncbi:MarR family winged helix-turn-helix transcriptional regulator [Spirochaeta lutea]|uniref:HTH marR-type domain-containing protein n=1 Tax=Spirochaeta lutea TaxID=1480694 RepID=A0A098QTI1_9SPIO|nr:MarR family transcriptional regulator [Spirochaeta lutea]KGE71190.1 hypothetical protein DC28_12045 [Spirochaeta lutea]